MSADKAITVSTHKRVRSLQEGLSKVAKLSSERMPSVNSQGESRVGENHTRGLVGEVDREHGEKNVVSFDLFFFH